jgi:hypothetical protein
MNIGKLDSGGDLTRPAVNFRNDVANDGEHGSATVLDLAKLVALESLLVDVLGQSERTYEVQRTSRARLTVRCETSAVNVRSAPSHVPKNPTGAIAPSEFSKPMLRAVEALPREAGAKAAALTTKEAAMASFMISY